MMALRNLSADSLLSWAMQTGLAVTVLILLVLIIRRPFAKLFGARAAYALWVLPLLRVFLPTVSVPDTLLPWTKSVTRMDITQSIVPIEMSSTLLAPSSAATAEPNWALISVVSWLCGALLFLVFQINRHKHVRRELLQSCAPASEGVRRAADSAASELGLSQRPALYVSETNAGPMIMGVLAPVVILPRDFEAHFNAPQRRLALLHEFAHLRRLDLWAATTALVFRALNWPNPLVHFAGKAFRTDQESACDATVLSLFTDNKTARQSYGETLVQAAKLAAFTPSTSPRFRPTDVPIGLTISHPLKERLMTLKTPQKKVPLLLRSAAITALAIGTLTTVPYSIAASQPDAHLAGSPITSTTTSSHQVNRHEIVSKVSGDNNGNPWTKTFEINVINGAVEVFETDDVTGRRRAVAPSEIRNFNAGVMAGSGWSFIVSERGQLILLDPAKAQKFVADGKQGLLFPPSPPSPPVMPTPPGWVGDFTKIETEQFPVSLPGLGPNGGAKAFQSFEELDAFFESGEAHQASLNNIERVAQAKSMAHKFGMGPRGEWDYPFSMLLPTGDTKIFDTEEDLSEFMESDAARQMYKFTEFEARAKLAAAQSLLNGAQDFQVSDDVRDKLEEARRALDAAQDALDKSK